MCKYVQYIYIYISLWSRRKFTENIENIKKLCIGTLVAQGETDHLQLIFTCAIFMPVYNICVWYPWYIMFIFGIHYRQYQCLLSMILSVYVQYLWLVSILDNTYAKYPWYRFYMSHIQISIIYIICVWYAWYICLHLASMIQNFSFWYPWLTTFMPGPMIFNA